MLGELRLLLNVFVVVSAPPPAKNLALFAVVPRSHWAYPAYDQLVAAKLANYPDCCYGYARPALRPLTRYEFAVTTQRALRDLNHRLHPPELQQARRIALRNAVRKLAIEFAPEIKQL